VCSDSRLRSATCRTAFSHLLPPLASGKVMMKLGCELLGAQPLPGEAGCTHPATDACPLCFCCCAAAAWPAQICVCQPDTNRCCSWLTACAFVHLLTATRCACVAALLPALHTSALTQTGAAAGSPRVHGAAQVLRRSASCAEVGRLLTSADYVCCCAAAA
jgi:hypothetical protein